MTRPTTHLGTDSIERFVYRGPDAISEGDVVHLSSCAICASRLADEARLAESMRESAGELDQLPERRQSGFMLVTAMVLLMVLCGVRLWPSTSAAAPAPALDAGPSAAAGPLSD